MKCRYRFDAVAVQLALRVKRAGSPIALVAVLAMSCTRSVELGTDFISAGGAPNTEADVDASTAVCEATRCDGKIYACGDCLDNDADGVVDEQDPECLGACDDTEDSYYNPVAGQRDATCKLDCYFDGDNGSGNDDCYWSHRCDPLSIAPEYFPSGDAQCAYDAAATIPGTGQTCDALRVTQSKTCLDTCLPRAPIGCDCFGCCELPRGSNHYVWLGSTLDGVGSCDSKSLTDATRCRPCTPVLACLRQ
ncbi:MAG TPA: hypothetical protein VIV60_02240 [Polyangiaceae bacterium]